MSDIRGRILQTSRDMFFRYGIKSITMDDICREMGISKKTFYQFFEEKNQLVEELVKLTTEDNLLAINGFVNEAEHAIHEFILLMRHMSGFFSDMNPVMLYDMYKYHVEAYGVFRKYRDKEIYRVVKQNLERGIKEKLYRDDIPVGILAKLRIEEVNMMFNPEIFSKEGYSFVQVQLELMKHFLHGIVTLRGHKLVNEYMHTYEMEK